MDPTKICSKCQQSKPLFQFSLSRQRQDGHQRYCKPCASAAASVYWRDDQSGRKDQTYKGKALRVHTARVYMLDYLSRNPCIDCGESDIVVLQFDHVRGTKVADVTRLVNDGHALERVQEEVLKCDVRCANCHTRQTAQRANWARWRIATA